MKQFFSFFLLIIFFDSTAQVIIVSKARGNDAYPGTDAFPVATIKRGVEICPLAGTVLIESEVYLETSDIAVARSMTIQKRLITDNVIINAQNRPFNTTGKSIFLIQNLTNVTIQGIQMKNLIGNGSNAVYVKQGGSNISIYNCSFENIGWKDSDLITPPANNTISVSAIKVEGYNTSPITNILIRKNEVFNCATGYGEAITITGNVDDFTIDSNKVHHISNIGIDAAGNYLIGSNPATTSYRSRNGKILNNEVYNCMSSIAPSAGIYLDGAENCIVDRNKVYRNGVGISIGIESTSAIPPASNKIRNNVIFENCISGMEIGAVSNRLVKNIDIFNNTFFKNRTMDTINGIQQINGIGVLINNPGAIFGGEVVLKNSDSVSIYNNNIYRKPNRRCMYVQPTITVTNFKSGFNNYRDDGSPTAVFFSIDGASFNGINNISNSYFTLTEFRAAWPALETNTTELFPAYVDSATRNLKLLPASPLINMGDPASTLAKAGLKDFDGTDRIICNRIDIGAYELNVTAPVTPTISPNGNVTLCATQATLTSSAPNSNQWYKNGVAISGAINTTYIATANGSYTVQSSNGACPSAQSAATMLQLNPLPATPLVSFNGSQLTTVTGLAGYQWFFNNMVIAGAITATYTPLASGLYKVTVTNTDGCSATSAEYNLVLTGIGNVTLDGNTYSIYPNPADKIINLKVNGNITNKVNFKIINSLGAEIIIEEQLVFNTTISISHLPSGIYFIVLNGKKENGAFKIIINH